MLSVHTITLRYRPSWIGPLLSRLPFSSTVIILSLHPVFGSMSRPPWMALANLPAGMFTSALNFQVGLHLQCLRFLRRKHRHHDYPAALSL
ncbi:hypothetical protein CYLTODRAFT_73284 [Cylindrobasidium torrendii FP15055 ss-10]|uniref:Uncharacterized protein n=1 Tax=Cylindrobasidium torrendii FP15055 ss-10 TaxID=1314674 RepID=A0A0D7B3H7_9AGAR|nr:hypothetical protein CYLTODRAFT_73284 [Cylindrobasidium torrendii FP15055 ss-10]